MELHDPRDPKYRSYIGDDSAPNIQYWPLQWAATEDLTRGIFTAVHAQALFEQAFGPTFTTQYRVRYERDSAWMARFTLPTPRRDNDLTPPPGNPMVAIELCFNASRHWRVSGQHSFASTTFVHTDDPAQLLQRLAEALARLV